MTNVLRAFRLPPIVNQQLLELTEWTKMRVSTVITVAIDRYHFQMANEMGIVRQPGMYIYSPDPELGPKLDAIARSRRASPTHLARTLFHEAVETAYQEITPLIE